MSNVKLKEQIEAAKIALVHSAEAGTFAKKPPASGDLTPSPSIGTGHAQPHGDSATDTDGASHIDNMGNTDRIEAKELSPISTDTQIVGEDTRVRSDFEKLEVRLQGLEDQIKNQQRDLQTLLQKLRSIVAKSQAVAEPKKSKGGKRAFVGAILFVMVFGAVYYWLGAEVITSSLYQVTGFIMALIDTLAGKI